VYDSHYRRTTPTQNHQEISVDHKFITLDPPTPLIRGLKSSKSPLLRGI
jgi:hypothetical protein